MRRAASEASSDIVLSVLAYVVVYAVVTALSFPGGSFLTIAGGFLFGWLVGGVLSIVGATIGATAIYLVARSALRDVLIAKAGPRLQRFADGFRIDDGFFANRTGGCGLCRVGLDAIALAALRQLYQLDRRRRDIEAQQWLSFLTEKHVFSLLSR